MSPDHNAMIGEAKSVSRFLYATGFSGHGFLQGPATGEILRDLVLGRDAVRRRHADERRPLRRRRCSHRSSMSSDRARADRRRPTSTSPLEALRDAIVDGRLRPGERIKEIPLAEELGFSRAPVRDALRLLERDGLVELVPNRGAIVPELRAVDVLEVYALRASLGTLALHKLMLESGRSRSPRWSASCAPGASGRAPARARGRRRRPRLPVSDRRRRRPAARHARVRAADLAGAHVPRRAGDRPARQRSPRILAEVEALHEAIVARDAHAAERLWREKFERWIRDLVGRLDEDFDDELWVALTRAEQTLTSGRPGDRPCTPRGAVARSPAGGLLGPGLSLRRSRCATGRRSPSGAGRSSRSRGRRRGFRCRSGTHVPCGR